MYEASWFRKVHQREVSGKCKYEPPHDKTNKMTVHPAKTQISIGISPVWSEPLLCAQWLAESSLGAHAILLVLSWGGSYLKGNTKPAVPSHEETCAGVSPGKNQMSPKLEKLPTSLGSWDKGTIGIILQSSHVITETSTSTSNKISLGTDLFLWKFTMVIPGDERYFYTHILIIKRQKKSSNKLFTGKISNLQ